jgi:hypothetical protein
MATPRLSGSLANAGRTPTVYNFAAIQLQLAGVMLSEYGPDGSISMEPQSDEVSSRVSADGIAGYSYLNDKRIRVTITVMNTSQAFKYMFNLARGLRAVHERGLELPPVPFVFFDPKAKWGLTSQYAICVQLPSFTVEKEEGTSDFVWELPYGRDLESVQDSLSAFDAGRGVSVVNPVPNPVIP